MILINKAAVRRYVADISLKDSNGKLIITKISRDFWPVLDQRVKAIIGVAVQRNAKHRRLTAGEL